jgi:hypothetical protein
MLINIFNQISGLGAEESVETLFDKNHQIKKNAEILQQKSLLQIFWLNLDGLHRDVIDIHANDNKESTCILLSEIRNFLQCPFEAQFFTELGLIAQKLRWDARNIQKKMGAFYTPPKLITRLCFRLFQFAIFDWSSQFCMDNNVLESNNNGTLAPLISDFTEYNNRFISEWFHKLLTTLFGEIPQNNSHYFAYYDFLIQKIENITVFDPSCGAGDFLLGFMDIYISWRNALSNVFSEQLNPKQCKLQKIMFTKLFGCDIDSFAVELTRFRLFYKFWNSPLYLTQNIPLKDQICICNFLDQGNSIPIKDVTMIIGNPPYVNIIEDMQLRDHLKIHYPEIYHGKLDLCYYFLPQALKILQQSGWIGFVIKRYFLKSPTATNLRKFLQNESIPIEITDYENDLAF